MIKFREVRIAQKVKRSDAGDISPVAMFIFKKQYPLSNHCSHFEYAKYDFYERLDYLAEKCNDATWCYLVAQLLSFNST